MASISVGEQHFTALAHAAQLAQRAGNRALARQLDTMARKVNAALSNARSAKLRRHSKLILGDAPTLTWEQVPSTLEKPHV